MPSRRSLRVGLSWLIVLVGAAWYWARATDDDELSATAWLVVGLVFLLTVALGSVLMAEPRRWLLLASAALGGGLLATVVFSMSVFSVPNNLDSYYPQFVFVEFFVFLLVPLAIGAFLGLVAGRTWLLGLALLTCGAVVFAALATRAVLHPGPTPQSQLSDIAAHSATPVYYAGPRFHGLDLDAPVIFTHDAESADGTDRVFDPGDRLDVGYGSTCDGDTCGDSIDIQMHWGRFPLSGCVLRASGPRGTLLVQEGSGAWDAFTGDLTLRVEELGRDEMVDLLNALRPAADRTAQPGGKLPAPSAALRRLVQQSCP